ncbi:hypothetical protein RRG08_038709 [Elysia crispata]|uniref:Uncharacterized protein n=1 Tax=Elysia crispata TaxID=231223 RepID=A0AAE0ZIR0_9GAST|nr:hypothetical protein RRG08_038709 [Elysia crispata]
MPPLRVTLRRCLSLTSHFTPALVSPGQRYTVLSTSHPSPPPVPPPSSAAWVASVYLAAFLPFTRSLQVGSSITRIQSSNDSGCYETLKYITVLSKFQTRARLV